ncbi:MAG: lactate racemase domain-containing protein [Candidatus Hodarchaeota archaeon]
MRHSIAYGENTVDLEIPDYCNVEIVEPKKWHREISPRDAEINRVIRNALNINRVIRNALNQLQEDIEKSSKVIIACDDNTRVTPVKLLLMPILSFSKKLGKEVEIIIAGGSHRKMDKVEKVEKFGGCINLNYKIIDHDWDNDDAFVNFGKSREGYDLKINKHVCDPGIFLIGMGNIVPHRVAGFSGGYKILLPGLSSPDTINKIHFTSAMYKSEEILGHPKNPVRDMINEIHDQRPINFLVNTVLDGDSNIISLCMGDPISSQYQGASVAKEIYGVKVNEPADVVISDSVPEVLDFWVGAKAVVNTKSFVKKGGHLIVLTPCIEGLSPSHGQVLLKYGYHSPAKIQEMVEEGGIDSNHLIEAAHLVQVGEVVEHCNLHLVSDGLDNQDLEKYNIHVEKLEGFQELISEIIKNLKAVAGSKQINVKIVRRGSEILPLV